MVNPAEADLPESELDLVVAGTDDAILMVEAGANEITEAELLDALDIAHEEIKKLCAAQRELARAPRQGEDRGRVAEGRRGAAATQIKAIARRRARPRDAGRGQARAPGRDQGRRGGGARAVRRRRRGDRAGRPASAGPRCSARSTSSRRTSSGAGSRSTSAAPTAARADEIREVTAEVGIAPRTHGSALFTRGPDPGVHGRDARHEPRGAAPRHARARDVQALLPPLQLPAVLGRGGRLHARARSAATSVTARSPSGRSLPMIPLGRRSSRTRSASCPTSSSPTAPRRWPRCAARRCR